MRLSYNKSQLGDVPGPDTRGEVLLEYLVSSELVAECQPPRCASKRGHLGEIVKVNSPRPRVVLPTKDLNLAAARAHSLDHPVHLVRLAAGLAHFRNDDVGVKSSIDPRGKFEVSLVVCDRLHPNQHVLFGVVEPVPCATCAYDALQLFAIV